MAITGNKGEWSEIYTHFKLLADGILYDGDNNYRKTGNNLPIVKISRTEKNAVGTTDYIVDKEQNLIRWKKGNVELQLDKNCFGEAAVSLLKHLKEQKSSDDKKKFSFPDTEDFMKNVNMYSIRASSNRKEDIRIVLHDIMTEKNRSMGFSIKSRLGGQSTLFNSNKDGTNFRFHIDGCITNEEIQHLNSLSDTKEKRRQHFLQKWFDFFDERDYKPRFTSVNNKTFSDNLAYIDSQFEQVMATFLLLYYSHKNGNKVSDITRKVAEINPCNRDYCWYEYKMKQFLLTIALGMTPNTRWDCKYAANGGYIVVLETGDVLCYHFYDREQLENYLFQNTAFDTPSTSRHLMYQIDEATACFNLNLQIRFIHKV